MLLAKPLDEVDKLLFGGMPDFAGPCPCLFKALGNTCRRGRCLQDCLLNQEGINPVLKKPKRYLVAVFLIKSSKNLRIIGIRMWAEINSNSDL